MTDDDWHYNVLADATRARRLALARRATQVDAYEFWGRISTCELRRLELFDSVETLQEMGVATFFSVSKGGLYYFATDGEGSKIVETLYACSPEWGREGAPRSYRLSRRNT